MKSKTKCECCGYVYEPGYSLDGIPNGLTFQMPNGIVFSICGECLIDKTKREAFIKLCKETLEIQQLLEAMHEPIDEDTLEECFIDRTIGAYKRRMEAAFNTTFDNMRIIIANALSEISRSLLREDEE